MHAMITKVSAVDAFITETANQYNQILNLSGAALSQMDKMTLFVEGEKEKLERQMIQLAALEETLTYKRNALLEGIKSASKSRDDFANRYYRANNRDEAAAYQSRLEEARAVYASLSESYETTTQIQKEIEGKKQQLQMLFRALSTMIDALKMNSLEGKKYTSLLGEEMAYNSRALSLTLGSLQSYIASPSIVAFGAVCAPGGSAYSASAFASAISSGSSGSSGTAPASETKRKTDEYKAKTYRIKSGSLGYLADGSRPVYRVYHSYSTPVKNMLYDAMKCMHTDFREAVMRQLGGVMFLNAKHGFNYSRDSRGRMIHIIGIDVSSPDFSRQLLLHVGHHLYALEKSGEKLAIDRAIGKEIARNMQSSNQNIQKIANSISYHKAGPGIRGHKSMGASFSSAGSKFFAQCFRAYVTEDHAFLSAVKDNFGESYQSFAEIIARLPKK